MEQNTPFLRFSRLSAKSSYWTRLRSSSWHTWSNRPTGTSRKNWLPTIISLFKMLFVTPAISQSTRAWYCIWWSWVTVLSFIWMKRQRMCLNKLIKYAPILRLFSKTGLRNMPLSQKGSIPKPSIKFIKSCTWKLERKNLTLTWLLMQLSKYRLHTTQRKMKSRKSSTLKLSESQSRRLRMKTWSSLRTVLTI